jgi:hypothetical protein
MLASGTQDHAEAFLREMEASVQVYEQLASQADGAYHFANGLRQYQWSREGIREFRSDLQKQKQWLAGAAPETGED